MKHAPPAPEPDELTLRRVALLEEQLAALSRKHVQLGAESRAQAGIIRRRNVCVLQLTESLRRLLLAYSALARVRDTARPARVWDTGTPGVEVSPR